MNEYSRVDGHDHLLRDDDSQAVINNDVEQFNRYINRRNAAKQQREKVDNLIGEVNEIKVILSKILEKIDIDG